MTSGAGDLLGLCSGHRFPDGLYLLRPTSSRGELPEGLHTPGAYDLTSRV